MSVPLPPAPPRSPRSVRHPVRLVRIAQTLYGDGSTWTPTQIVRYLRDHENVTVALDTVRRWVDPAHADEQRRQNRLSYARRMARGAETPPPVLKHPAASPVDLVRELRGIDLSFTSISKVLRLYHGLLLDPEEVRHATNYGHLPQPQACKACGSRRYRTPNGTVQCERCLHVEESEGRAA